MDRPKGLDYIWAVNTISGLIFYVLSLMFFYGTASYIVEPWLTGAFLLVGLALLAIGRRGLLMDLTDPYVRRFSVAWIVYGLLFMAICFVGYISGTLSAMPAMLFFIMAALMVTSADRLSQGRRSGWWLSLLIAAFWMLVGGSYVLYFILSPTMTAGWEIDLLTSTVFFLPGIAMTYYLLRQHVRGYFE